MLRHAPAVLLTALYVLALAVAVAHAGGALLAGAVVLTGLAARVGCRLRHRRPARASEASWLTVEAPASRPAVT
jgi:hypothetical protein